MLDDKRASLYFYIFVAVHVVCWTLFPLWDHRPLHPDTFENFYWGQEWQLGYFKHPPLFAWVTAGYLKLTGITRFNTLLLSQLNHALAFFFIWKLALRFLKPASALIAVALLEFIPFYNFLSFNFSANTILLTLWPAVVYYTHKAITENKLKDWFWLGVFAGASVLGKYFSLVLLAAIFVFLVLDQRSRRHFRHAGPYVCLFVFFVTILPHVRWMFDHDFASIRYGVSRTLEDGWLKTRLYGLKFTFSQAAYLSLIVLIVSWCTQGLRGLQVFYKWSVLDWNKRFLWSMSVLPCLMTAVVSMAFGIGVSSVWGMALWAPISVLLILHLENDISPKAQVNIYKYSLAFSVIPLLVVGAYANTIANRTKKKETIVMRQEVAQKVTELWRSKMGTQLPLVMGDGALVLPLYSEDHPSYAEGIEHSNTPWADAEKFSQGLAVMAREKNMSRIDKLKDKLGSHPIYMIETSGTDRFMVMLVPPID